MKKSRLELREAFQKLTQENLEIAENNLELMHQTISEAIKDYKKFLSRGKWNEKEKKIEDIFYDSLTQSYEKTVKSVNSIYEDVKEFDIKDVFQITYRRDGLTLQERIKNYWAEAWSQLQEYKHEIPEDEELRIKLYLDYYLDRLLNNETRVIENVVKKNKRPLNAGIVVIEGGCSCGDGYCDDMVGEYPIGEEPDEWPPFHPYCECIAYYDTIDDWQELEDIDAEADT